MITAAITPEQFGTFGDLLRYLRKREELTQQDLALRVGYSNSQISRLEQNRRVPDEPTLAALFVPALHLQREPAWTARLLDLAQQVRLDEHTPQPSETANALPALRSNLPAALTTFIGREKEQTDIAGLLRTNRLVTLTGEGGVGKTRTSLQVGAQQLDSFPDGVWLVELAPLSDPALIPQAVLSALDVGGQSALPPVDLLVNYLRSRELLLILDNCEHLMDASAVLAETLLARCTGLTILATSREGLSIPGEKQYPLPTLRLPDVEQTLEVFRAYESVRLFEERAQLTQPDFVLTLENAASIAQICNRLDGIPLAIELAAARINMFSSEQIAARLGDRFDLLTGGSRTAMPRQQTIRASIDWSWDLLSESERALFRRLPIFAGGWTLAGAEAVCSGHGIGKQDVLPLLTQLVAKSLVLVSRQPGHERRFLFHETIRHYALERLAESGEDAWLRDSHLAFFVALAEQAEEGLKGPRQKEWDQRLTRERENIWQALEYAVETDVKAGLDLCGRLSAYWLSHVDEGVKWTTIFLSDPRSAGFPLSQAKALITQSYVFLYRQEFEAALQAANEAHVVFTSLGDRQGEFDCLLLQGWVLSYSEGMDRKVEHYSAALEVARSIGDEWRVANALVHLGWDQRDPPVGRAYWEEGIALLREVGDWRMLVSTLGLLGFSRLTDGDVDGAEAAFEEALSTNENQTNIDLEFTLTGQSFICLLNEDYEGARAYLLQIARMFDDIGNQMGSLWARMRLAYVAVREGNVAEARHLLDNAVSAFQATENPFGLSFALEKVAALHVISGRPKAAASLIGWADATRERIGFARPPLEQEQLDEDIAAIQAATGLPDYEAAYLAGRNLSLDKAVALALNT
jgi:predicted ATPase/DNA-binding XRE family transcriptional regulator